VMEGSIRSKPAEGAHGAAPALSSMYVTYIESPEGGREEIGSGVYSTSVGHAGTEMSFGTVEMGYGDNPIAKLDDAPLNQIMLKAITDSATNRVIGFERVFHYSGKYISGGSFTYQNTSTNAPHNTLFCILNIKRV